ncbi:MAG: PKD repeat protein, partial [Planctomycetota bacterium]
VDFSASVVAGVNPLTVSFMNLTDVSPLTSSHWDFGDGQTSNQANPTHVYGVNTTTSFTVTLTVMFGAQPETLTKTDFITVVPAPLQVDFEVLATTGGPPLFVEFRNLTNNSNVTAWSWDFGDGNTSALKVPTHTYVFPGTYDVSLSAFIGIQEGIKTKPNLITVDSVNGLTADYLVSATEGDNPLTVDFTNLSTGILLTGYLWDFGDGNSSTLTDPTHIYNVTEDSSFDVSLTVFSAGDSDTLTVPNQITVNFPFPHHPVGTTGTFARVIKSVDVNGDGALDVMVGAAGDSSVSWYENTDALGNFGSPQFVTMNAGDPFSIDTADFDGDGDRDVIVADDQNDELKWYANADGLGSFGPSNLIVDVGIGFSGFVTAADLDGDGDQDFIGKNGWYENTDGLGSFTLNSGFSFKGDMVEITDIDLDGELDVFLVFNSTQKVPKSETIYWYKNQEGHGAFALGGPVSFASTFSTFPVSRFASADMDLDGDMDLAVVSQFDVQVYANNVRGGQGFLQAFSEQRSTTVHSVSVADINGDGLPDVVTTEAINNEVLWYANSLHSGMLSAPQVISTTTSGARNITTGDLDGDGDQDILSLGVLQNSITWFENSLASTDWPYLAPGLPGKAGHPVLSGSGELTAGENVNVTLTNAIAGMPAVLVIGFDRIDIPILGGTLIPSPDFKLKGLFVDAGGELVWDLIWPPGLAPDTSLYFQYFVSDPTAVQGLSASNGIRGTSPR